MIAYTMTRRRPSYQLLLPSEATAARTPVDRAIDTSSKISKSRVMSSDVRREAKMRNGATNRAIWVVEVVALATLSSDSTATRAVAVRRTARDVRTDQ